MSNYTTEKIGCGALTLLILSGIALIGLIIGAIVNVIKSRISTRQ